MKIALISDTHDNVKAVEWIIDYLNRHSITTAFHAGDIVAPGNIRRFISHYHGHLHFVFGNNDGELSDLTALAHSANNLTCHNREMDLTLEGKRIFMNHYSSLVEYVAKAQEFDLCIGGHDHIHRATPYGKTLFINPGHTVIKSPGQPSEWQGDCFVVLDLETMNYEKIMVE